MNQIISCLLLNYHVISRGKLTGHIAISGYRANSYWV